LARDRSECAASRGRRENRTRPIGAVLHIGLVVKLNVLDGGTWNRDLRVRNAASTGSAAFHALSKAGICCADKESIAQEGKGELHIGPVGGGFKVTFDSKVL